MDKLKSYSHIVTYVVLILLMVNGCSQCSSKKQLQEQIDEQTNTFKIKIGLLEDKVDKKLDQDVFVDEMWNFLEFEEISDKNRIPIKSLRDKNEVKNKK